MSVDPGYGAEGPKRPSPVSSRTPTPSAPLPPNAPPRSGWREALIPGYASAQQAAVTGVPSASPYAVSDNGTFQFNAAAASPSGLVGQDGQITADIYYYYQPVGQYSPMYRFAGSGPIGERAGEHLGSIARATTIGQALESYWSDPKAREAIVAASRENYKWYSNWNPQWAEGFWRDLVNIAAANGQSPGVLLDAVLSGEMTVGEDTASQSGSSPYGPGGGGSYGGGGGGGSVVLTDPTSARGLLMQTMQSVLGRDPTNREYKDFLDSLNASEMENPRTVDVEGDVAVQSGGIDPSVLALEFAQSAKDYKETQANKFYNAFMGALGGAASGSTA